MDCTQNKKYDKKMRNMKYPIVNRSVNKCEMLSTQTAIDNGLHLANRVMALFLIKDKKLDYNIANA